MIEVDSLAFHEGGGGDQLVGSARVELEPALQQAVQLALFHFRRRAIERDDMDQQGRRRQPIVGIVEGTGFTGGRNQIGNELAQSIQHRSS
jgi:hypothetical protein